MSVMLWDSASQAFVEAQNTPMVYDTGNGAWRDTTGLVWDNENQAWREAWCPTKYLYNNCDECTDLTGGFTQQKVCYTSDYTNFTESHSKESTCLRNRVYVSANIATSGNSVNFTVNKIDVTKYSTLHVKGKYTLTNISTSNTNIQEMYYKITLSANAYTYTQNLSAIWLTRIPNELPYDDVSGTYDADFVYDLSTVSGSYIIGLMLATRGYQDITFDTYKIWLE